MKNNTISLLEAKYKLDDAVDAQAKEFSDHLRKIMWEGYDKILSLLSDKSCFYSSSTYPNCKFEEDQSALATSFARQIWPWSLEVQKIRWRKIYYHTQTLELHQKHPNLNEILQWIADIIKSNTILVHWNDEEDADYYQETTYEHEINSLLKLQFKITLPKTNERINGNNGIELLVITNPIEIKTIREQLTWVLS